MLVSVIMLSYNYAEYLPSALESLAAQTHQDWELIAVDDGSTDGSLKILEAFKAEYPYSVRVFTHPGGQNLGIQKSLELALSKPRGEVIAFLEADDRWHPQNLEKKIRIFQKYPTVGVVTSHYLPFGHWSGALYWKIYASANKLSTPLNRPYDAFDSFLHRNPAASFSHFAVRRHCLQSLARPAAFQRNLDWWILAHLSVSTLFYFLPESLSFWRIHRGSAGYGRVRLSTLWRLHHFLVKLYGSVRAALTDKTDFGESERLKKLDQALRFQDMIQARNLGPLMIRIFSHPLAFMRFMSYVFLRNLLLT